MKLPPKILPKDVLATDVMRPSIIQQLYRHLRIAGIDEIKNMLPEHRIHHQIGFCDIRIIECPVAFVEGHEGKGIGHLLTPRS